MLASLGLTTVFYCILLLALQGKLLTCLPLNPPTGEQGKGETCQIQHSAPVQGWKREKHGPAEGSKRMLKGLFLEGGEMEGNPNTFEK